MNGKKISNYKDENGNEGFHFHCEGCKSAHGVYTYQAPVKKDSKGNVIEGKVVPVWGYNGNEEKPTFTPSILAQWEEGPNNVKKVCHSFVTDGNIRYLNDCTHHLKGKTVELLDF
jgi:hypothetical protein